MDKNEYNLKLQEIERLAEQGNYAEAAAAADTVDWKRVRNVRTLCMISEIYEAEDRYEDSKAILLRAYRRSPMGKTILYRLVEVTIALKQFDEAIEYYSEYVQAAPHDNNRYILKYKIYRGRGSSIDEQIEILKEYLDQEYNEKYAYELAKLYRDADRISECMATCDDLVLWFHSGKYVIRALELKMRYQPLTPKQQEIYDHRFDEEMEEDDDDEIGQEKQIVGNEETSLPKTIVEDTERSIAQEVASVVAGEAVVAQEVPDAPVPEKDPEPTKVLKQDTFVIDQKNGLETLEVGGISEQAGLSMEEDSPEETLSVNAETASAKEDQPLTVAMPDTDESAPAEPEPAAAEEPAPAAPEPVMAEEPAPAKPEPAAETLSAEPEMPAAPEGVQTAADASEIALAAEEEVKGVHDPGEIAEEIALQAAQKADMTQKVLNYNPDELATDVIRDMKDIVAGIGGRRDYIDEDAEAADRIIEESKKDQEAAMAARAQGEVTMRRKLEIPELQKKRAAGQLTIDDILLSMGERGVAAREAAARASANNVKKPPEGVLSALDEALLNMGIEPEEKREAAGTQQTAENVQAEQTAEPAGMEEEAGTVQKEEVKIGARELADAFAPEPEEEPAPEKPEEKKDSAAERSADSDYDILTAPTRRLPTEEIARLYAASEAEKLRRQQAADGVAREQLEKQIASPDEPTKVFDLTPPETAAKPVKEPEPEEDMEEEADKSLMFFKPVGAAEEAKAAAPETAAAKEPEDAGFVAEAESAEEVEAAAEAEIAEAAEEMKAAAEAEIAEAAEEVKAAAEAEIAETAEEVKAAAEAETVEAVETAAETEKEPVKEPETAENAAEAETAQTETRTDSLEEDFGEGPAEAAQGTPRVPDHLRNLFKGFLNIRGVDRQIAYAIEQALAKGADKTSRTGNVLIYGAHGSGKTTLAVGLAKAIAKERGDQYVKMARIYATDLNRKDIAATIAKIAGGILIIEEAGDLQDAIADQLTTAMEFRTDGLIIIMEDEQKYIRDVLMRHPRFTMKFTSQINLPEYTVRDLIGFAQVYADGKDYTLSPEAEAALGQKIEKTAPQTETGTVSVTNILEMTDAAIRRANKMGRKLFAGKKRFDEQGRVILLEKDFR